MKASGDPSKLSAAEQAELSDLSPDRADPVHSTDYEKGPDGKVTRIFTTTKGGRTTATDASSMGLAGATPPVRPGAGRLVQGEGGVLNYVRGR